MLRVQVKVEEAVAEIVKEILTKIFVHIKPLCGKCASQGAVVYKRTFPGTSTSGKLLVVSGRGLAAPPQVRLLNAPAMPRGQGRREGGISADSWQQGRNQEIILPRRMSHRHRGTESLGFREAPSAALPNLASKI